MGDLTLFEALTGGAFDRLNWQYSGEFDQNFSKKSNARGFARGGGWAVLELTGALTGLRKVGVLPVVPIFKCHLPGNFLRLNFSSNSLVLRKMIPYSRPKLYDFYTLF